MDGTIGAERLARGPSYRVKGRYPATSSSSGAEQRLCSRPDVSATPARYPVVLLGDADVAATATKLALRRHELKIVERLLVRPAA